MEEIKLIQTEKSEQELMDPLPENVELWKIYAEKFDVIWENKTILC